MDLEWLQGGFGGTLAYCSANSPDVLPETLEQEFWPHALAAHSTSPPRRRGARVKTEPGSAGRMIGGLAAIAGFFLPYLYAPDLVGISVSRSGAQIGEGLWIVFLAAAVIIGSELLFRDSASARQSRRVAIFAAWVGIGVLLYGGAQLVKRDDLFNVSAADFGFRPGLGALLSAGGLLTVILSGGGIPAPSERRQEQDSGDA